MMGSPRETLREELGFIIARFSSYSEGKFEKALMITRERHLDHGFTKNHLERISDLTRTLRQVWNSDIWPKAEKEKLPSRPKKLLIETLKARGTSKAAIEDLLQIAIFARVLELARGGKGEKETWKILRKEGWGEEEVEDAVYDAGYHLRPYLADLWGQSKN